MINQNRYNSKNRIVNMYTLSKIKIIPIGYEFMRKKIISSYIPPLKIILVD